MSLTDSSLESLTHDQLVALLRLVQQRLGTQVEEPGDLRLAQMIAHEINNRKTVHLLGSSFKEAFPDAKEGGACCM